jgi:hypothetical protein
LIEPQGPLVVIDGETRKRSLQMHGRLTWVTLFSVAFVVVPALCQAQNVPAAPVPAHHRGCSVASLKGTYAFRRTGVNNVVGGPIAAIGIEVFNGDGTLGLTRFTRSTNGEIQDWSNVPRIAQTSYTVHRDCTGSLFTTDGTKTNNLVVLDGGKRFFLLSVAPDTITTEEGTRLEVKEKD